MATHHSASYSLTIRAVIPHEPGQFARVASVIGEADAVLGAPKHPYTQALISAIPEIDSTRRKTHVLLPGDPPNPEDVPPGCAFNPRCPIAQEICRRDEPPLRSSGASRARCHFVDEA